MGAVPRPALGRPSHPGQSGSNTCARLFCLSWEQNLSLNEPFTAWCPSHGTLVGQSPHSQAPAPPTVLCFPAPRVTSGSRAPVHRRPFGSSRDPSSCGPVRSTS